MSKYWKDMFITKDTNVSQIDNDIIISKERPIAPVLPVTPADPGSCSIAEPVFFYDYNVNSKEICEFINYHNCTVSGTIEQIDIDYINKLRSLKTIILCLKYQKTGKIMGILFDTPLQITITDLSKNTTRAINHGYTYYMCVHKKLRGNGLSMALIRELIRKGYQEKIAYCGYHLVDRPHTATYTVISSWFRPINYDLAIANGFKFLSKRLPEDRTDVRTRNYYVVSEPSGIIFSKINHHKITDNEYTNNIVPLLEKYSFALKPNLEFFREWCSIFDTYTVVDNGIVIGMFSVKLTHPFNLTVKKQTNVLKIIWCAGKQPQTLQSAVYVAKCKYQNIDILYGYKMSGITNEHISTIHAGETKTHLYFEMYNNSLKPTNNDLCIPFL